MKKSIVDFIQRKQLTIPLIHTNYEDEENEVICYIRFYIPNTLWEFYIYEINETCDYVNALVYSPYTHRFMPNIPDHGLVPLDGFCENILQNLVMRSIFLLPKLMRHLVLQKY